eukprot:8357326-Prorocentrum_lima.AAC.1
MQRTTPARWLKAPGSTPYPSSGGLNLSEVLGSAGPPPRPTPLGVRTGVTLVDWCDLGGCRWRR